MEITPKKRKADELSNDEDDRKIQQLKLEQNGLALDTKVYKHIFLFDSFPQKKK